MGLRMTDNRDFYKAVQRMIRAAYRRASNSDPEDFSVLGDLSSFCRQAESDAVKSLRVKGYSWSHIGSAFGISKQAAFKRWGQDND